MQLLVLLEHLLILLMELDLRLAPCPSSQESVGVLGGAFEEIGAEDPDAVDGNVDHIYTDVVYAYL